MYSHLKSMKKQLSYMLGAKKEATLQKFIPEENKILIFADYREKGSPVIKQLLDLNVDLKLDKLEYADYLLSRRVAVEFKTVQDFVDSIMDNRLMEQIRELKRQYERPVIIIEGIEDIYSVRNIHPNAIRGMIANIIVSYGIPLIYTKSPIETASLLFIIAKREQEFENREFMPHSDKRIADTKWLQEYIISALPGIGAVLAKPLLQHFKSIKNIVNASVDELKEVEGIGKKKAEEIRKILDEEYKS
jgi:Fanconi anemia group M protein